MQGHWYNLKMLYMDDQNKSPIFRLIICHSPFNCWKGQVRLGQDFSTVALPTFWASKFSVVEAALCIAGCLATALASTHAMSVALPSHLWQPNIPPDMAKCLQWDKNHPSLRTVTHNAVMIQTSPFQESTRALTHSKSAMSPVVLKGRVLLSSGIQVARIG